MIWTLCSICYQFNTLSAHRHPPSELYRFYSYVWCVAEIYRDEFVLRPVCLLFKKKKPLQTGILLESTHLTRITFAYVPIALLFRADMYLERQGFYLYLLGHIPARFNETQRRKYKMIWNQQPPIYHCIAK